MKAVVMNVIGTTSELEVVERQAPTATPGRVIVDVAAAGVNFMDIGVRQGMAWTTIPNPKILGVEGAGRVIAVGEGVDMFEPGERVAWVYEPGSYTEQVSVRADALVKIPDGIDDRTAAAVMMQGLTASHFATDFYPVQPGDIALVHAAAGGVGLLLTQIIKLRGGTVIGRVGGVALTEQSTRLLLRREFHALIDRAISRQVVLAWVRSWRWSAAVRCFR